MSTSPLVYIDTNVFALVLLPHPHTQDPLIEQADRFILDIEDGKYRGITSTLTEIEYRGTAKRRISENNRSQISPKEEIGAMNHLHQFIRELGIGLVDADTIAPDMSGQLRIFMNAGNTVRLSNPVRIGDNQWKMIRSVDALMVNIAVRIGANLFATCDRGFRGLDDQSIVPLIVSEVY